MWLAAAFPVLFVVMWCLVLKLLSHFSGWARLAQRFRARRRPRGEYYRFQSARLSGVNFNGCLEVGVSTEGLYLVPFVLFRLFHPPLLIPWGEIEAVPQEGLLFRGYRLTFRSFPRIRFDFPGRTFDRLVEYLRREAEGAGPPPGPGQEGRLAR